MSKKVYDDDDGRTIADMSGLEGRSITSVFRDARKNRKEEKEKLASDPEYQADRSTRRSYTFGAVGAGLLIGMVYLVAFAALILFLLFIWGVL